MPPPPTLTTVRSVRQPPRLSRGERLLEAADLALRVLFAPAKSSRPYAIPTPANSSDEERVSDSERSEDEKQGIAALIRVDHAGEICAQALYSGQALATTNAPLRAHLASAGREEMDHLAWTEQRLKELGARTSLLNPFWYAGAFAIGYAAARLGDDWSLGFVVETERQVEAHLQSHLDALPADDLQSRALLAQMQREEAEHRQAANDFGARKLPAPIQTAMRLAAKVMTTTAARV